MQNIRVASVQFEHAANDKKANFCKIRHYIESAAQQGVEIIAFPECCVHGYWHLRKMSYDELAALAESVPSGPSTQELLELSRTYNMTIGAGFIEAGEKGAFYNTYVIAMPNGEVKWHRKIHAFENQHVYPGSEYTVFDTPHGCRVGVLICYDCNIIENVRINALMGAEILIAPHQTGGCELRSPHIMGMVDHALWENRHENPQAIEAELRGDKGRGWLMRWLPARAHDNGIFMIFSNGVGVDDDEIRTGNAMIIDPYGRILAETWKAADDMVVTELDASLLQGATGRGWIRTRRPELYTPLTVPTGMEEDTRKIRFSDEWGT